MTARRLQSPVITTSFFNFFSPNNMFPVNALIKHYKHCKSTENERTQYTERRCSVTILENFQTYLVN